MTQVLKLAGKKYVLIEQDEFERLTGRNADDKLPALPEPDADGRFPAIAYGRALLARRIAAARHKAGWSQAELARRAGIRKETVCRIEACRNNPDEATFGKIERAMGKVGIRV